ncbi:hypothetical protein JCM8097_005475 [Rhodosporidiobolus ruineniae]
MADPRPHLLPDYDPATSKVNELRGILNEHEIPYPSNAKKPQLVLLFERHIRPLAPALLAQSSAVRPSSQGILDGDSHNGSLEELNDSEDEREEERRRRKISGRKSVGRRKSEVAAPARGKGKGRARDPTPSEDEAGDDEDNSEDELAMDVDQDEEDESSSDDDAPRVRKKASSLAVSPRKRKAQETDTPKAGRNKPRTSLSEMLAAQEAEAAKAPPSALKRHKHLLDDDPARAPASPAASETFSDYNPFQSAGEDTPGREVKRRKSSAGPSALKPRRSALPPTPSGSTSSLAAGHPAKSRKSMPASLAVPSPSSHSASAAGAWSDAGPSPAKKRKSDLPPPVPAVPAVPSAAPAARKSLFAPTAASSFHSSPASTSGSALKRTPSLAGKGKKRRVEREPTPEPEPEPELEEEEEEEEEHEVEEEMREDEEEDYPPQAEEDEDVSMDVDPVPSRSPSPPPPPAPAPASAKKPRTSAGGTPLGVGRKSMVPVDRVKVTPPDVAAQLRAFEARQAQAQAAQEQQEHEERQRVQQVTVRTEEKRSRASEPHRRVQAAAGGGGTPRRSVPAAAERQVVRAAPAPPQLKPLKDAIVLRPPPSASSAGFDLSRLVASPLFRLVLLGLLATYGLWYRAETLAVGFCDSSSPTNPILLARSSTGQTSAALPSLPSLPSPVLSFLDASHLRPSCTPCPSHGVCASSLLVGCEADYVPRPSLLRSLTLGLITSAPSCEADTEKQVAVARQAASAGRVLRRRKGEVMCVRKVERARRREAKSLGIEEREGAGAEEAWVYGLEAEGVLGALRAENEASGKPFPEDVLDEINRLALRDLEQHGEVVVWQHGTTYWYASKVADMPLSCRARLAAIRSAKKHKLPLLGIFSALAAVWWARRKLHKRKEDQKLVKELVQTTLRHLQAQERAHQSPLGAVSAPYPYLAPSHLFDLLLDPLLFSSSRRRVLWAAVTRAVEGNANVRTREVEQGGEEMRGWEWTGPRVGGYVKGAGEGEEGDGEGAREMVQVGGRGTPVGTPARQ